MCTLNLLSGKRILVPIVLFLCSLPSLAQGDRTRDFALGSFNSFKGVGLSAEFYSNSQSSYISAILDLSGIIYGISSTPGFKACYHHVNDICGHVFKSGRSCSLFAGPGIIVGYVRDVDPYMGALSGISGIIGARMSFGERFRLALAFQADLAVHIYKDHIKDQVTMSLYRSGFNKAYYPQMTIEYCF